MLAPLKNLHSNMIVIHIINTICGIAAVYVYLEIHLIQHPPSLSCLYIHTNECHICIKHMGFDNRLFPSKSVFFFVVCTSSSSMLLRYVLITTIGQNDANKDLLRNGSVHTFIDKRGLLAQPRPERDRTSQWARSGQKYETLLYNAPN